ncbi:hypothetical protein AQ1_02023 [alpha proteobacterium Q-1]|nr:hypothetical protein AQ1_02023 [alpha proteobacterium Q-1]
MGQEIADPPHKPQIRINKNRAKIGTHTRRQIPRKPIPPFKNLIKPGSLIIKLHGGFGLDLIIPALGFGGIGQGMNEFLGPLRQRRWPRHPQRQGQGFLHIPHLARSPHLHKKPARIRAIIGLAFADRDILRGKHRLSNRYEQIGLFCRRFGGQPIPDERDSAGPIIGGQSQSHTKSIGKPAILAIAIEIIFALER